jgi:hypothetical protein
MSDERHVFVMGRWQDNLPPPGTCLMIADPVYGSTDSHDLVRLAVGRRIPSLIFMMPEDVWGLPHRPDQVLHWVKPVSTKNTVARYSRFVEAIACYGARFWVTFGQPLHWSNRTGIFTDGLLVQDHEWKKPESLIERLVRNHYSGEESGVVYDPCAGSRTVEAVCRRLGIPSFSVDSGDHPDSK